MEEIALHPERILVVKVAGIGDLLLSVPALRALRARFPEAVIDLLVSSKCSDLFKNCPYVDHVFVLTTQGMMNRIKGIHFWSLLKTLFRLRRNNYHLLINLYHLFSERGRFRFRLLTWAVGARRTLGRNTDGRGTFYDFSIADSWEKSSYHHRHEAELSLDVVRLLGAEDPGEGLEFWVREEDRSRMQSVLARQRVLEKGGPRVVLNVGGDARYKRWPEENFSALGDLLMEKVSSQVLIVGAGEDRCVADSVIANMKKRPFDLVGSLTLLELAALFESSDLVISNDTGPMHLAASVGTPVIALFGPGKPDRYAPYGPRGHHVVIHHPVVCSPCTEFDCSDRDCMRMIEAQEVYWRAEERLAMNQEACS